MLKKRAAAAAIVAAMIIGAPLSAQASVEHPTLKEAGPFDVGPYVPSFNIITGVLQLINGSLFTSISFLANSFHPSQFVTFFVVGPFAGGATIGVIENSAPFVKQAAADGSVDVTVALPANASGTYTVTATDESGTVGTTTITIAPADSDPELPNTGSDFSTLALLAGGGTVLLGAATLVAAAGSRRRKMSV